MLSLSIFILKKKEMKVEDCEKGKCRINISEKQYGQLRKEFIKILIPTPEQRNPKSWAYATERRTLDELMVVVKLFIAKRLVEYVKKKE